MWGLPTPQPRSRAKQSKAKQREREREREIKLDVRKAFDSISQQYLSTLVKEKVGTPSRGKPARGFRL